MQISTSSSPLSISEYLKGALGLVDDDDISVAYPISDAFYHVSRALQDLHHTLDIF